MKRKLIISGALILLLAVILFMGWDLFYSKPANQVNPYAYNMDSLKAADTSLVRYAEVQQIKPGLSAIHGIAVGRLNHIYVSGDSGVEIFDAAGKRLGGFALREPGQCIHVDPMGVIYIGMTDHLETHSVSGSHLNTWKSCGTNAFITSVAVNGDDVYVADAGNKVVYHYNGTGKLLQKIGQKDPEKGIPGFVIPSPYFDLGVDPKGELWVVNPGRYSFEHYGEEGELISSWGKASMTIDGFCGCCNPTHFARLSNGSFVTSEKGIERLKVYTPGGDFRCVVAAPGQFAEGTKGLDLAVDADDRILVLDPEKNMIRIFTEKNKH